MKNVTKMGRYEEGEFWQHFQLHAQISKIWFGINTTRVTNFSAFFKKHCYILCISLITERLLVNRKTIKLYLCAVLYVDDVCLPASAAPPVVIITAITTPNEGTPFLSIHTPMLSVKSGRQRLNTTYMGRLRPRKDHRVRVDCSVERIHTGPNSCRDKLRGRNTPFNWFTSLTLHSL